jgi:FKBP-type peptidyl-prolyl cis-trans isomerase
MSFGLTSCLDEGTNGENPYERLNKEIAEIDQRLLDLGHTSDVIKDPTGIRIVVEELGTGLPANLSNKIDVDYTGRLFSTDAVFDDENTTEHPSNVLSGYIDGWRLAFSILPVGTTATLYIPSGYAYGNRANGSVPANSILKFDVKFNGVIRTSTEKTQFTSDTSAINTFLALKPEITGIVKDSTGLRYRITETGEEDNATWYDQITMNYKIYLLSNPTNPVITVDNRKPIEGGFASRLVDYIHGMKVGLSKMNVGSKATLYIPSGLAFGPNGATDNSGSLIVPANANIIVEIEVEDIDYKSL